MDVIQAFAQLDHATKIDKLKHLVEIFAPYSVVAKNTLELIDKYPDPLTDDEMIDVYGLFVKAIQETKSESLQEAVSQLSIIQDKLLEIHRREEQERQKDNPDSLLQNL
jgi:hypothetical protein